MPRKTAYPVRGVAPASRGYGSASRRISGSGPHSDSFVKDRALAVIKIACQISSLLTAYRSQLTLLGLPPRPLPPTAKIIHHDLCLSSWCHRIASHKTGNHFLPSLAQRAGLKISRIILLFSAHFASLFLVQETDSKNVKQKSKNHFA